jgi:signal transduction histidine kinase
MMPRRAESRQVPRFPGWLLAAERSLRTHPAAVAVAAIAATAVIAVLKLRLEGGLSMALSYMIPVAFCAYSVGFAAALVLSIVVSGLWIVDTTEVELATHEVPYVFLVRLLMSAGVAAIAAVAGAAARERERYVEAQRELERLRADMVAAFSHDLRSPLGTIAGYAELLREDVGRMPSEWAEATEAILAAAHRLDKLIAEMLGATRNDGTALLRISHFAAAALVAELRSEFDLAARSPALALRWQVGPNLPELQIDRSKLVSIVRNLVNNALKYTRHGTVWVRLSHDAAADVYCVEVEDTGPGIAPEELPHLFDRFYRAAGGRGSDGFGLGLFIVKRFTELLQGSIIVDSEVGRGTRMVVTVPRVLAEPPVPTLPMTAK